MNLAAVLPAALSVLPPELRQTFAAALELATIAQDAGPPKLSPELAAYCARVGASRGLPPSLLAALAAGGAPALPAAGADVGRAILDAAQNDPDRECYLVGAFFFYLLRGMDPERAREIADRIRG